MTAPLQNNLDELQAELVRQRQALGDMQRRLAETKVTITSRNHAVSVSLDGQGNVVEIKFPSSKYRAMAPTELGALLVETIGQARTELTGQLAEFLGQLMPGTAVLEALNGDFNVETMLDDAIAEAASTHTFLESIVEIDDANASQSGEEQ